MFFCHHPCIWIHSSAAFSNIWISFYTFVIVVQFSMVQFSDLLQSHSCCTINIETIMCKSWISNEWVIDSWDHSYPSWWLWKCYKICKLAYLIFNCDLVALASAFCTVNSDVFSLVNNSNGRSYFNALWEYLAFTVSLEFQGYLQISWKRGLARH